MNEVVRLINIVLIMLLIVSKVGCSNLKTKGNYFLSGPIPKTQRLMNKTPSKLN